MTNTEEVQIQLCTDCALIVANDDDSGCADPEAKRGMLALLWAGYRLIVLDGGEFFSHSECDGCRCLAGSMRDALAVRES